MPVINFSYSDLCDLLGREVGREVIRERLPMMGADMRSAPDDSDDFSFEFFPDRPDLYSVEGIARALRAFLDIEPGLRSYAVGESDVDLLVDPSVDRVRPYIWSALVEGNDFTDPLIRSVMDLQEKLHLSVGRNRKKVAIGIHDFRTVRAPFTYKAVLADEVSFIPLQGSKRMTPAEILREHEKGRAYAFVLEGQERYPIIVDREGEVLSFPPIINGVTTALTENTRDILVDCTGTDLNAVMASVNILVTALAERGGKVKTVKIHQGGEVMLAPDLKPRKMLLDPMFVNMWNGTSLPEDELAHCMRRMGYGASPGKERMDILVPAYRSDILHQVDLAEDAAIGHGFDSFGESLPKMATFGTEDRLIAYAQAVKTMMVGLGYSEVVTLSLSCPEEQFDAMNLPHYKHAVVVKNPVSEAHVLVRTSLLPSLLTILRKNKHRDLPQRLFEVGDVVLDTKNRTLLSGVAIHSKASFTEVKSAVQAIMGGLEIGSSVRARDHASFIDGRCAEVVVSDEPVGVFGELKPSTIEAFELRYPVVGFELDMEALFGLSGSRKRPS
ncbi:MAG: phenylalanine--tRNA ligase subunit beta [Candidatus Thermoplasmatota archaeon]|nr:phenylalanine--tRNA ligase subunit beta [Candidatus Thermoplasmatota archaeon]